MSISPLRIEILIAGFFYFGSFFFFSLKLFGVKDLSFLVQLKDFMAFLLIGALALAYVFGIMAHRLIPIIITQPLRNLQKWLKLGKSYKYYEESQDVYGDIVASWQYSTERINQGLNYHFSLLVLFRLLVLGSILLGCSISFWLLDTPYSSVAPNVLVISVLFSIGCYISFRKQRNVFTVLEKRAFDEVSKIKEKQKKQTKKTKLES